MKHQIALSFDVDWAKDWILEETFELLKEKRIKATWFFTHRSDYVEYMCTHQDLIEIGVHPNFFPGSTHEINYSEVVGHITELFPSSKIIRTDGLYQSERLLEMTTNQYGLTYDCSIFVRGVDNFVPHYLRYNTSGNGLTRLPHFFQDNMEMENGFNYALDKEAITFPGLIIINFDATHLSFNTYDIDYYK